MNQFVFVISLLAIASCQQLVVDKWVPGNAPFSRDFRGLQNIQEFSAYGWIRFDPNIKAQDQFHTIFALGNTETFINDIGVGQQAFSIYYNNVFFDVTVYSTTGAGFKQIRIPFSQQDFGQWIFIHASYSPERKRINVYIRFPVTGVVNRQIDDIVHNNYDLFKVIAGQNGIYGGFPGELRNIHVHFGSGSYKEDGFESLYNNVPDKKQDCIVIYSECNFKGEAVDFCKASKINNDKIKSIYIPPSLKMKLKIPNPYHPQDDSKAIYYQKTTECIAPIVWTKLVEEEAPHLRKQSKSLKKHKQMKH